MDEKAIPFKECAGIDLFSLHFENYQTNCIEQIRNIDPDFWGINIENRDTTKYFEVEYAPQGIGFLSCTIIRRIL